MLRSVVVLCVPGNISCKSILCSRLLTCMEFELALWMVVKFEVQGIHGFAQRYIILI